MCIPPLVLVRAALGDKGQVSQTRRLARLLVEFLGECFRCVAVEDDDHGAAVEDDAAFGTAVDGHCGTDGVGAVCGTEMGGDLTRGGHAGSFR